jgi:hypothetical protein
LKVGAINLERGLHEHGMEINLLYVEDAMKIIRRQFLLAAVSRWMNFPSIKTSGRSSLRTGVRRYDREDHDEVLRMV